MLAGDEQMESDRLVPGSFSTRISSFSLLLLFFFSGGWYRARRGFRKWEDGSIEDGFVLGVQQKGAGWMGIFQMRVLDF